MFTAIDGFDVPCRVFRGGVADESLTMAASHVTHAHRDSDFGGLLRDLEAHTVFRDHAELDDLVPEWRQP